MPRILLDACLPHFLRKLLPDFDVTTAHYAGLDQLANGELLDAVEGRFDILVTKDQGFSFQQRIRDRTLAVVVIRLALQTPEAYQVLVPALTAALRAAPVGQVVVVGP